MTEALTERQQQVLEMLTDGKGPTEIGAALEISSQAVHGHMRRLRSRGLLPGNGHATAAAKAAPAIAATLKSAMKAIDATFAEQRRALERSIGELDREREAHKREIDKIDQQKRDAAKALKGLEEARERVAASA